MYNSTGNGTVGDDKGTVVSDGADISAITSKGVSKVYGIGIFW